MRRWRRAIPWCLFGTHLAYGGDGPAGSAPANPPAAVDHRVAEADLTVVRLTAEAEQRLAIATAPVVRRAVASARRFAAVATIAPGREYDCVAPIGGVLARGVTVVPGAPIATDSVLAVVRLGVDAAGVPLALADRAAQAKVLVDLDLAAAQATAEIVATRARLDAARLELGRAEKLVADQAGSARALEVARAAVAIEEAALLGAERRTVAIERARESVAKGGAAEIELRAPFAGELRSIAAHAGQILAAGTVIAHVADVATLHVRVALPVGEAARFAALDRVTLQRDDATASARVPAMRVIAPASGDPVRGTLELAFEVRADAFAPSLAPGERLIARAEDAAVEASVVPHSAIVRDFSGGEWVYAKLGPGQYSRRRVAVRDVAGGEAILASGPPPGTEVVIAGVAELFGTEFGAGK